MVLISDRDWPRSNINMHRTWAQPWSPQGLLQYLVLIIKTNHFSNNRHLTFANMNQSRMCLVWLCLGGIWGYWGGNHHHNWHHLHRNCHRHRDHHSPINHDGDQYEYREDQTEASANEMGRIVAKLPMPPGCMTTLYGADQRSFLSFIIMCGCDDNDHHHQWPSHLGVSPHFMEPIKGHSHRILMKAASSPHQVCGDLFFNLPWLLWHHGCWGERWAWVYQGEQR